MYFFLSFFILCHFTFPLVYVDWTKTIAFIRRGKVKLHEMKNKKKHYMSFLNTRNITKFEAFRLEHFVEHKPSYLWRMKDKIMEGMSPGHTGRNDIKSYHLRRPNAVLLPDQLGQFLLAIMHLVIFFLMWKMQLGIFNISKIKIHRYKKS